MEITQQLNGDVLDMRASGRIDGYWADHLERALADVLAAGHHRVRLDCADVKFLSSAGIAALMKFRKDLARVDGTFHVVNPSKPVAATLAVARLNELLIDGAPLPAAAGAAAAKPAPSVRRQTIEDAVYEIYELDARATLECRAVGDARLLATGAFTEAHVLGAGAAPPAFAVGIGAFGDSFDDCRPRFGELLSVAGATVYQPADGTNVPDYLLAGGQLASEVRLLYGLTGHGTFSHVVRFEAPAQGTPLALSRLLRACLDLSGAPAIGMVVVAETVGLVGAALRRSPAEAPADGDFFAHPGVRARLAFTAEPAFTRGVTLAAGVVERTADGPAADDAMRPLGDGCAGHLHAAAFPFRAIKKGRIDLRETVASLFDADPPLGVLHLLHDDRERRRRGRERVRPRRLLAGPRDRRMVRASRMLLLLGALTIGLILSLLAFGVFISFRIFEFPDITAEGSITLGGAVAAVLLVAQRQSRARDGPRLRRGRARRDGDRRPAHAVQDQPAALRHPRDDRALLGQPARDGEEQPAAALGAHAGDDGRSRPARVCSARRRCTSPGGKSARATWRCSCSRSSSRPSSARCSTCSSGRTSAWRCRPPATTTR